MKKGAWDALIWKSICTEGKENHGEHREETPKIRWCKVEPRHCLGSFFLSIKTHFL